MEFDKAVKVTVTESGSPVVEVVVDSGAALIGSGGHCDVRLLPDRVAVEQLFLENQPGGLFAESRAGGLRVLGAPFDRGRVLPNTVFTIGSVSIRAEVVDPVHAKEKKSEGVRPGILILAAIIVPLAIFSTLAAIREAPQEDDFKPSPPLFETKTVPCPEANAGAANAAIEGWLRDAYGRHERSPFSPQDGVEAVQLYRRAGSCMERFGRQAEAAELKVEVDGLAQRLERDFHVHRVRLARALSAGDYVLARHEVGLLRSYVGQKQGEFAQWLDYLDRQLGLRASAP